MSRQNQNELNLHALQLFADSLPNQARFFRSGVLKSKKFVDTVNMKSYRPNLFVHAYNVRGTLIGHVMRRIINATLLHGGKVCAHARVVHEIVLTQYG